MPFQLCLESDLEDDVPFECDGPDGEPLVVVRHGGVVYAVSGECPHQAAPMADAEIGDGQITCCLHFWTWRLADGEPLGEAEEALPVYPVKVENGNVVLMSEKP